MGFFDDPTTAGMLGMAGGFAQAGQASRLPTGGMGAALADAGGGMMAGMQAGQAGQLQAQQVQAGQMNNQFQQAMLPQRLALLGGGSAPGSFAGPQPQQPGLLSRIGSGLENSANWASKSLGGDNLFNTTPAPGSFAGPQPSQGGGQGGLVTQQQQQPANPSSMGAQALQQIAKLRNIALASNDGRTAAQMDARMQSAAQTGIVVADDGQAYPVPNAANIVGNFKAAESAGTASGSQPYTMQNEAYQASLTRGTEAFKSGLDVNAHAQMGNYDTSQVAPRAAATEGAKAPYTPVNVPTIGPDGMPRETTMSAADFAAGKGATNGGVMPVANFVQAVNGAESGGNSNATNARSTASGNGQFLQSTWLPTFRAALPQFASLPDDQALALRNVPAISNLMTGAYAQQNAQDLAKSGIAPTADALGLAHHFGAAGAAAIINAPPNTPIANIVGADVLAANPDLQGQTAGSVGFHAKLTFGTAPVQFGAAQPPMYQGKPIRTAEQEAIDTGRGNDAAAVEKEAAGAPQQMAMIDNIRQAAQGFRTGATGDARLGFAKTLTDGLQALGFTAPASLTDGTASGEAISKLGGYLAAQQTRMLGSREAASVFNQIKSINPGITSSPAGLDILLNSKQQDLQRTMDLRDFQSQWVDDRSHNGSTKGMQQAFEQQYPIQTYASRVLPYSAPSDLKNLIPNVIYKGPNGLGLWNGKQMQPVPAGSN